MSASFDSKEKYHKADEKIIPLGISAGAAKPTTGYAFLRMRQHAKEIVAALQNKTPIPKIYRKARFRFYDRLLLDILEKYPMRGKEIFMQLFESVPHAKILKFLDEKSSLWEEISIFRVLPKRLFLRALIRDFL